MKSKYSKFLLLSGLIGVNAAFTTHTTFMSKIPKLLICLLPLHKIIYYVPITMSFVMVKLVQMNVGYSLVRCLPLYTVLLTVKTLPFQCLQQFQLIYNLLKHYIKTELSFPKRCFHSVNTRYIIE